MADKRIQDLTAASSVQTSDRFVLEQSGQAKSLTGQILINDLAAFLDGHGGINDITYTPPSGSSLTGTLTVTLADGTVETFSVTNGRGITGITQTGTSGLEDTYEITYNDGSTPAEFTVTNGRGIESIGYVESVGLDDYYEITYNDGEPTSFIVHNGEKGDTGDNWYVHIRWAAAMPTQDSDILSYPSDYIGIYAGISETAPTSYGDYDWYKYKGEKGDTGTGITGVLLESSSGLVDTYRVSFDDGTSTTFNVTNGSQIDSITKTSSSGLIDTYTVTLTNGLQTSFQVTNGKSINSITWTSTTSPTGVPHVPGATDTYTIAYNNGDATTFQVYNGLDGEGASLTVDGIPSINGDVPLLTIDTEHGAPTPLTVGSTKSRYFDALNSVLYICLGYDENVGYLWRGAGVTVDAALSTSSTNPVQNRVITNKIGTAALDTTAQDLSGAVNEILDDISGFADNLADEYDATATYAVGDLCLYDNTLYSCNTAIATPEAWNSIHWTATSVDDELDTISNDLDSLGGTVSGISSTIGNTVLPTTAQTLTGAIAELDTDVSGKVSKYGDTMTGDLTLEKNGTIAYGVKNGLPTTTPSSNQYYIVLLASDSADARVGNIQSFHQANGNRGIGMEANRTVNGSTVNNSVRLGVNASGNRTVTVTDSAAWRDALGLGTSGALPITISQGGTGQTAVESTTTKTNIATAASGFTISAASYAQWGKLAMLRLEIKNTNAMTSGANVTVATVVSGKRPVINATGGCASAATQNIYVATDGAVHVIPSQQIVANYTNYLFFTYLLP